jgi:uncharacterized membrane protein
LSFIGWALLSCLTFGIGFIALLPYVYTATVVFYATAIFHLDQWKSIMIIKKRQLLQ